MRFKSFCLAAVILLALAGTALAQPQRHRLPSGLTVITAENHEAKVVSFQVWVRAGSAFEKPSQAGITHLIEHMIFKGTPKDPQGRMAARIEGLGGMVNAYTTFDHTTYYTTAASRYGTEALELLADAVVNARFDPVQLKREKEVVIEELRMGEDDPDRRLSKDMLREAFGPEHPYGRPVIGFVKTVRAITRQDILDYRSKWYVAPNMVVVAVGDFKTAELLPRIQKAFAGLPRHPAPHFVLPPVKVPAGPRLLVKREKVRQAQMVMTWRIPGLPSDAVYPMDMAATVAGGGEASRLYADLKEKRGLVDDVDASAFTPHGVGLLEVSAQMSPEMVQKAWRPLLAKTLSLVSQPPRADELSRARVNLSASFIRSRQTMEGQARMLGYFELLRGGFEKLDEYLERFKHLGAAQVAEACSKYLTPARLSVVIQIPKGAPAPSQKQLAAAAAELARGMKAKAAPAEKTVRSVLPCGMTLLVKPAHNLPLVSMVLTAPGGQITETGQDAGLYSLWARALTRGSVGHSYDELVDELESMAGELSAFSGKSAVGLTGSFLSQDWRRGLELLAETWEHPTFAADQVNKAREDQLAALRDQQNSPVSRAFLAFRGIVYGKHPFDHNPLGSPETLKKLGAAELKQAHSRVRGPGGTVLAVVGDVSPELVKKTVMRLWKGQSGQVAALPDLPVKGPGAAMKKVLKDPKARQTQIVIGYTAPGSLDQRRFSAEVLQAVMGGFGGPLFKDLRAKRSLAYVVQPFYFHAPQGGVFGVYMGTGAGKEPQAIEGLRRHLKEAAEKAPSKADLARAKAYLLGEEAIGMQTYSAQASAMASYELLGLGYDFQDKLIQKLQAVTARQVLETARAVINPRRRAMVTLGP